MEDIFDHKILCSKCNVLTKQKTINKNGFKLRVKECPKCKKLIYHPMDLQDYNNFNKIKSSRSFARRSI